jgi:hypothetical protein
VTEATQALVEAVREFLRTADVVGRLEAPLAEALEAVDSETCSAELDHHHGKLTCTRKPGHPERRHRDYLRGEWNEPEAPSGLSRAERLDR